MIDLKKFVDSHIHMREYEKGNIMLDYVADCGVTDVVLQALPKYSICENLGMLYWKINYKKINVLAFGGLHHFDIFSDIPYEKQAQKLLKLGFDGMKFLEMKPDFRKELGKGLNDPSFDNMFSLLEEQKIPITIHCADPEKNWDINKVSPGALAAGWFYGDGTFSTKQELYDETLEMLRKHPQLKVSLAHFFFLSNYIDEAERVLETYPNVYFDLTPGWEMYVGFSKDIEKWHDFFVRYSDRILFGTDTDSHSYENAQNLHNLVMWGISRDYNEFAMPCYGGHIIKGLNLPCDVIEKITYKNFEKFSGKENIVKQETFIKSASEVLSKIKNHSEYEREIKWLESVIR